MACQDLRKGRSALKCHPPCESLEMRLFFRTCQSSTKLTQYPLSKASHPLGKLRAATIRLFNLMTKCLVSACSWEKIYLQNLNRTYFKMRTLRNEPALRKSRGLDLTWRETLFLSTIFSMGISKFWALKLNLCSLRRRVELWRKLRTNSKFLTKIYFHIQILILILESKMETLYLRKLW